MPSKTICFPPPPASAQEADTTERDWSRLWVPWQLQKFSASLHINGRLLFSQEFRAGPTLAYGSRTEPAMRLLSLPVWVPLRAHLHSTLGVTIECDDAAALEACTAETVYMKTRRAPCYHGMPVSPDRVVVRLPCYGSELKLELQGGIPKRVTERVLPEV